MVVIRCSPTLCNIFFHHQTTTYHRDFLLMKCCVISSFITKPQPITPIILIFNVVSTTILYRKWVGDTLIARKITKKILIVLVLS